ncbi:MAG: ABC transporter permease, partial [Rhodospirillaceae bacterium]
MSALVQELIFALRMLWREARGGEFNLLAAAVVIAVAGVTTVGFFTGRVHHALDRQASVLLGADLVVGGDRALTQAYVDHAQQLGLNTVSVLRFPSMAVRNGKSVLADVKVVSAGYPLRGELRVADVVYGNDRRADAIPRAGTLWADERLFHQLGLVRGDVIELGSSRFTVDAVITQEPDAGIGLLNAAPRVMMNAQDVQATGLIQPGSRIRYRLLVAGAETSVERYRAWAEAHLQPGQRIEGVRDARPEIRSALERAERFLSLAALVSVVVAAAATALAARRFVQRHLDGTAVMRCLGATRRRVVRLYAVQLAILGLVSAIVGCLAGVAAQAVLAQWLAGLVNVRLPPPAAWPAVYGVLTGVVLLLGFALPPFVGLGRIGPLRVLRRDLGVPGGAGIVGYALGVAAVVALIYWRAGEPALGSYVVGGFAATIVVGGLCAWLLVRALGTLRYAGIAWRFGVANLQRRALGAVVQTVALAVGIMALLTL